MKLHSDRQLEINKDIVTHIVSVYGISDFTFKLINEGIENTSVYVETKENKYVLRIYSQNKKTDDDIFLELEFQDYLRIHQIPIPRIYSTEENKELAIIEAGGKRWQVILMEFKEGESTNTQPSPKLIMRLAEIQAKMHLLGIEFAEKSNQPKSRISKITGSIADRVKNSPVQKKEVLEFIERVRSFTYELDPHLPHGYNHLDLDFDGNVLTKENKVTAIIDFDDLKYSPSIMCLGFTLWNILDDSGLGAFELYLHEYQKIRPLTSFEHQALPHIIFFRNYQVGIIRLLLWENDTPLEDITDILKLEKDIPSLLKGI